MSPAARREGLDASAMVAEAHACCDRGLPAEAELIARRVLVRWPGQPTARVALARAMIGMGRHGEAQALLFETIHAHPGYASAQRWLAEALLRSGDRDRGRAFLQDALGVQVDAAVLDAMIVRKTGEIVLPAARPTRLERTPEGPVRRRRGAWQLTRGALATAILLVGIAVGSLLASAVSGALDRQDEVRSSAR